MVAKIISGKSLKGALHYNENKVIKGKAKFIGQSGFHKEIRNLTFKDKLYRLQDLATRNFRVKTNTIHISLNFAVDEDPSEDKLNLIAKDYMNGIGFGRQPYLIYEHKDAGHSHIHIISTNIQTDGSRISLHNLGKTKSEETRKHLEIKHQLKAAEQSISRKGTAIKKLVYGKCETKRAISNVVNAVISEYKFTSVPEFNAILNRLNIYADRGEKDSRMFKKEGLIYWALDEKGQKIGVPIKASSIYGNPGLKKLNFCFEANKELRKPSKESLKSTLDKMLMLKVSKEGFELALAKRNIEVVFRYSKEGRLYGATFVDHDRKTVFKGSDLGKAYSASALEVYFKSVSNNKNQWVKDDKFISVDHKYHSNHKFLVESLLQPEFQDATTFTSFQQKFKSKKKYKRPIN